MDNFRNYMVEETHSAKIKSIDKGIKSLRHKISQHLSGKNDKVLCDHLSHIQKSIGNISEDTTERFMLGILKENMFARMLVEPRCRNINKNSIFHKYLLDRGVNLEIIPHKRIKGYRYKSFDIKFAIQLGNDASIANKIASIKTYKPTTPTILVQSFPSKITQDKIDSWKQPNLMIMGVEEFIEWSKIN